MRLSGKKALITGGGQGIGKAIALAFAIEGADVAIDYVGNPDGPNETGAAIRGEGRKALVLEADVSNIAAARKLVADAAAGLGGLDILVNNAGIEKRAPFLDVAEADYQAVINVNMTGPFFLSQAFARLARDAGRPGRIVNISSVHEELPFPHFAPYCMSKGGLKMMMRDLAVELAPLGITVNNIAPGAIETPINSTLLHDPKLLEALKNNIPLGRLGKPRDVASLAIFLASDEADYITGTTMVVDGGLLWNYSEQ
jgi:glucose 1-dehydrogenase